MRKSLVGIIVLLGTLIIISAEQLTTVEAQSAIVEVFAKVEPATTTVGQAVTVSLNAVNVSDRLQKVTVYLGVETPDHTFVPIASIEKPFGLHSNTSVSLSGSYTPDVAGNYTVWGIAIGKTFYSRGTVDLAVE